MYRVIDVVLRAPVLAMGISTVTLSVLKKIDLYSGFTMLGIGMSCAGMYLLRENHSAIYNLSGANPVSGMEAFVIEYATVSNDCLTFLFGLYQMF